MLWDLTSSTVFSHLDLNLAYHQTQLASESRAITTFQKYQGMFQNNDLDSAPKMYQKIIQCVFSNCQGVLNSFDDATVHGKGKEAHNANLKAVLKVLLDVGLTLIPDKCKLGVKEFIFVGHHISLIDIRPSKEKKTSKFLVEFYIRLCDDYQASLLTN